MVYLNIKYQTCKYSIVVYIQIKRYLPEFHDGSHDFSKTTFLTRAAQMGLTALIRAKLVVEGVANDDDISDGKDDNWDQFSLSCKRPGQILDANNILINQAPFILPVRSLKCLKEASNIACYYNDIGRAFTPVNVRYQVISNF